MSYTRVLPRDLFNEAKLLKCLGQLSLLIHGGVRWPLGLLHRTPPKGFLIHQHPGDGGLYFSNLTLVLRVGVLHRIALKSLPNSRSPYPLVFSDRVASLNDPATAHAAWDGAAELPALADDGTIAPEFAAFLDRLTGR